MKYAWIDANRDSYSVTIMCDLLSVSRSGLHDAHGRKPSLRTVANTQIVKPHAVRPTQASGLLWAAAHDPRYERGIGSTC